MKNIKLTAYEGNAQEMNDLVNTICKIKEIDIDLTRDKYKMLTNVTRTHLLTFCEKNNVNISFDFTGKKKDVTVFLKVKDIVWQHIQEDNNMIPTSPDKKEEEEEEKEVVVGKKEVEVIPENNISLPIIESAPESSKDSDEKEDEDEVFGDDLF